MPSPRYSHNHVVNQKTGYIENPAYASQFDSARKEAFLKLYRKNGLRLRNTCRSMGLSEDTVNKHYNKDPLFKKNLDDVEKDFLEDLEGVSKQNALNPRSVIERIFLLKCLLPSKYGQENKPQNLTVSINIDNESISRLKLRDEKMKREIIDVESEPVGLIENPKNL